MTSESVMTPAHEYAALLGEFPRFRADVVAHDGAASWTATAESVAACIESAEQIFPMPNVENRQRFQAQLWWWSTANVIIGASVAAVLMQGRGPSWEPENWQGFSRDDFWVGFFASEFIDVDCDSAEEVEEYGEHMGRFLQPILELVAGTRHVRPAPLWAVLSDSIANAAIAAGNELMEPYRGCALGYHLVKGLNKVHHAPLPRFIVVADGEPVEWNPEVEDAAEVDDFDASANLLRASCCMIYQSPDIDLCVSCPKRPRDERIESWVGMCQW